MILSKKGQTGIEGMIALGIVFFLFLGAYALFTAQQRTLTVSSKEVQEKEECLLLASSIVNIFVLDQNAQIVITLNHNFTIIPAEQRIESAHAVCTIPIKSISNSGSPVPEMFMIFSGEVSIIKKEWVAVSNV